MLMKIDRVRFDVNNRSHVQTYGEFISNKRSWKQPCPFLLEDKYESIPHMIEAMIAEKYCQEIAGKQ